MVQLARELTGASLARIGRELNRHHTTIHSMERRAHDLIDLYPHYNDARERAIKRVTDATSPRLDT
jgi:chromosomal replication initiation ATPase DnaA